MGTQFISLIFAHLLGDFILQSDSMVIEKERKKLRSMYFYMHVLGHGILAYAFTGGAFFSALMILISHGIIDGIKLHFQKAENKVSWFYYDQILHILVIVILSKDGMLLPSIILDNHWIKILTTYVFLTKPASVLIKVILLRWAPATEDNSTDSLEDAGAFIGILERMFILTFILFNHWEAIGFLLAAKSVFRFGDLKESKDRKLTEYMLIGTLISFGVAMLTGIMAMYK